MRNNGSRPRVRHATLPEAHDEARRIAANNPGAEVWVIECQTAQTVKVDVPA
jgi:hypothetical protein